MNVKKRPRLDLELCSSAVAAALPSVPLTSTTTTTQASVSEALVTSSYGSGQSLFLTSTSTGNANNGAQIFLTICGEDNSEEEEEYYAIKQEPDLDVHALLPTNLQLPTGCEIYLVKDTSTTAPNQLPHPTKAAIKLEPDSINDNCSLNVNKLLFVSGQPVGTAATPQILMENARPGTSLAPQAQPNVKLDAYKKRDDKRRATHNEVERRRRDKINCWIFKLKEMLPTEGNRYKPTTQQVDEATSSSSTSLKSNTNQNGRTPPNDSKSQILIKACDYIKSMQNEIDNLRECLREAEGLRLSNQALRDELDSLKQQHELQERFSTSGGGSFNVTLNSLNSSATSDLFEGIDTAPNLATMSSINFTKRGLMIADYDE